MTMAQIRRPKTVTHGLLNGVLFYIQQRKYEALSGAELAPGMIAISDSYGEVDIYFTTAWWKFKKLPQKLPQKDAYRQNYSELFPAVGLLNGLSTSPYVKDFEQALSFARAELVPTDRWARWHRQPKHFDT